MENGVTEGGMEERHRRRAWKRGPSRDWGNRPSSPLPHPCLPCLGPFPETLCREEGPGTSWEEEKDG